ncbi:hypothetical protein phiCTP1_gb56 [Clostridium phage phiCTP1]|uniref:hypothetical protein n=1 Tax=Clostridium phage phiCTP1 TaxID=871584 RepID=UPI0001E07849|nr:hypothetical protein phiCTP1_gb56 [Clostridium phage phiCTP1]ADL40357.1 hypothetical phage protein [Clostridium phage phiCTP1]
MLSDEKCRTIKRDIEQDSKALTSIVNQLIAKYSKELDIYVTEVKEMLEKRNKLSDDEVEDLTIKVPLYLYNICDGIETLGIEGDTAKQHKNQLFHEMVMRCEGTIRDKESYANTKVVNEALVEIAFQRAYKKLKLKMDAAMQICQSSRKVLSRRIEDSNINKYDKGM